MNFENKREEVISVNSRFLRVAISFWCFLGVSEQIESAGKLYIIFGPSGIGKTTLVNNFFAQKLSKNINKVVAFATRPRRAGEVDGIHYNFISEKLFDKKKDEGLFIETVKYGDWWYGTPVDIFDEINNGASYLLVVGRKGAQNIIDSFEHALSIELFVNDLNILKDRLLDRHSESQDLIIERLNRDKHEIDDPSTKPRVDRKIEMVDLKKSLKTLNEIIQEFNN